MNTPASRKSFPSNQLPAEKMGKAKTIILSLLFVLVGILVFIMVFTHGISDAARSQLAAIKAGDIQKAYSMTSPEFQEATSLEQFEKFLKKYPILSNTKEVSFSERKIDGDMGYLAGTVTGESGEIKNIEFQLIKKNGEWKIQGIQLTNQSTATTSQNDNADTAKIHAILVSDAADDEGFVVKQKSNLPEGARKIYVTVQLVGSESGNAVSTTLVCLAEGRKIGPAIDKTTKKGNLMKAFAFTRDEKTWPKGNYEVRVELSSGSTKVAKFKVT